MTIFRLVGLALLGSALLLARSEDRLALSALSGCGLENPLRVGGEISVETDRFFFRNLTAGYLALLPVSRGRDPFEFEPGVRGFEGLYLGVRRRFQYEAVTPFVGVSLLSHMLSEQPYVSVNPEVGFAIPFRERYEASFQLRYFLTSRGRGDDFLTAGFGLARSF